MAKKKVNKREVKKKPTTEKAEDKKLRGFVASFFLIIGFLIAIILWKNDKYAMAYAKRGLVLFIGFLIASALGIIPVIGWIFWVIIAVFWVITWIYALQGKEEGIWIVGDLAEKINL